MAERRWRTRTLGLDPRDLDCSGPTFEGQAVNARRRLAPDPSHVGFGHVSLRSARRRRISVAWRILSARRTERGFASNLPRRPELGGSVGNSEAAGDDPGSCSGDDPGRSSERRV